MGHRIGIALSLLLSLVACFSQPVSSTRVVSNIDVEMWASGNCVKPGETVKLRATVTNHDKTAHLTELKNQPVLDILVGSRRWSDGKPMSPDLTRLELRPGQSRVIEMDWTMPNDMTHGEFNPEAQYVYNPTWPDGPVRAMVFIHVFGDCPGIGP